MYLLDRLGWWFGNRDWLKLLHLKLSFVILLGEIIAIIAEHKEERRRRRRIRTRVEDCTHVRVRFSHMRNFLPMMVMVLPMPKSFGENHSLTSSSLISSTAEGKLAREERDRERGREQSRYMYVYNNYCNRQVLKLCCVPVVCV